MSFLGFLGFQRSDEFCPLFICSLCFRGCRVVQNFALVCVLDFPPRPPRNLSGHEEISLLDPNDHPYPKDKHRSATLINIRLTRNHHLSPHSILSPGGPNPPGPGGPCCQVGSLGSKTIQNPAVFLGSLPLNKRPCFPRRDLKNRSSSTITQKLNPMWSSGMFVFSRDF